MAIYFSKSRTAFFDSNIHRDIPSDAKKISEELYHEILNQQSTGNLIASDSSGYPYTYKPAPSLSDAKEFQSRKVNAQRDKVLEAGFDFRGNKFDSDAVARTNLTATVSAINSGITLPDDFSWRSFDNKNIQMSGEDLVALGGAMLAFINDTYARSWILKDKISQLTSVVDVLAVSWESEA